jgi:hypothetical protein
MNRAGFVDAERTAAPPWSPFTILDMYTSDLVG